MNGRAIIVANRVPYTAMFSGRNMTLERSVGGLATGLRGIHDSGDSLWVGSLPPDPGLSRARRRRVHEALEAARVVPVQLTEEEQSGFYESVSNGVLWPVLHSHVDRIPLEFGGWEQYVAVNRRLAEAVAEAYRPGDAIWVHDYQLMLVPRMVRELVPGARIGFFLHIPFPASDVFRCLPWRREILEGLLGADLVGFHVPSYMANFVASVRELLGFETDVDEVVIGDRSARIGVFPLGVDSQHWSELGSSREVVERAKLIREEANGQRLIVGIDRLDYTKGIPRRLLGMDRLLEKHPRLRERVRMVQVSVPSRGTVESYAQFRRQVDELVGRINGRWGSANWVPVHHIYRSIDDTEIAALYRAADVMVVSPVRDGMNLVAKEFVAARSDGDGTLVLSEFAGAASELGAAFSVNPYDRDDMADKFAEALGLRARERRRRMAHLRSRVMTQDAAAWADRFMAALGAVPAEPAGVPVDPAGLAGEVLDRVGEGGGVHLVLDYDGTLVPFAPSPPEARPGAALLAMLESLGASPRVQVDIVSGRSRVDLELWLGEVDVGLYAEHGAWARTRGTREWARIGGAHEGWRPGIARLLEYFLETTPESLKEPKGSSVAWHYRESELRAAGPAGFGDRKARELRFLLAEVLAGTPAHAVPGNMVVEIVGSGATKGIAAARAATDPLPGWVAVAIGDDRTDEDMFRALPPGSFTVKVGDGPTRAQYRLGGVEDVMEFLRSIVAASHPIALAGR